jgi:peptidoglycan-associated lipoprotein
MRRLTLVWWALVLVTAGCPDKKPKYPTCDGDKDCKSGEKCVNKKCVQCAVDGDCGPGKVCKNGGCEPIEGWCSGDGDCTDGKVCKNNACVACEADTECGEGGKCRAGKCIRKGQCETDDDCPEDQDCVRGFCVGGDGTTGTLKPPDCDIETVYFGFDQYTLSDETKASLERNFDCLSKTTLPVQVIGHTDPRGTEEYNIGLSDDRAQAVITYMTRLGIDPGRLNKVPKGATEATGTDEASWAKDRKVELKWIVQ